MWYTFINYFMNNKIKYSTILVNSKLLETCNFLKTFTLNS